MEYENEEYEREYKMLVNDIEMAIKNNFNIFENFIY